MAEYFCFSHALRPPDTHLIFIEQNISSVSSAEDLGLIVDKRITWRLHREIIEAKTFKTFITTYSVFRTEGLSANIKLTTHKALSTSIMTYTCPTWELFSCLLTIAAPAKQGSPHQRKFSKVHSGHRFVRIRLSNKNRAGKMRDHTKS
jgi:hypothetical protein